MTLHFALYLIFPIISAVRKERTKSTFLEMRSVFAIFVSPIESIYYIELLANRPYV